jgi:hypothetical protein
MEIKDDEGRTWRIGAGRENGCVYLERITTSGERRPIGFTAVDMIEAVAAAVAGEMARGTT